MMIQKISPSVAETWRTQLNEPTNQNPQKSPKLLSQRIRKHYFITFVY